jgi:opacity protein-like surface antigen
MGESEMKNIVRRAATAVIFALTSSAAGAADNTWNGAYAGFNAGQASSRSCSSWSAGNTSQISGELALAYAPDCGSHGAFLGGGQIGDNFQAGRVAWGIEAAFDIWEGSRTNQSATLGPSAIAGGAPAGTYSFTSRRNPDAIGMFTGRIGYSGNQWFPYLKAGALLAGGSQSDKLSYVPASGTAATASFTGAKSFASTGWVGGGGVEIGLHGSWSIAAEYLHASLGKGSSSAAECTGSAANCAAFTNASLQNSHGGFQANLIRITVNYWFDYW